MVRTRRPSGGIQPGATSAYADRRSSAIASQEMKSSSEGLWLAASVQIAALHSAELFHGDFRLSHFYYRGAVLSLWNPGWLRSWSGHLTERSILCDLSSLGAAICAEAAKHRPSLDDFISCDATAELLLAAYAEVAPGWIPPLGHLVRAIEKNCTRTLR